MLAVRSRLRPRIGRSLAFRRPWSASTRLLAYWVVSCSAAGRSSATTRTRVWARSVVISGRLAMGGDRRSEELRGGLEVSLPGHEHIDDLPVLVDDPVDVSPGPRDLHVGLVNEPVTAHAMAAWSCCVYEQGSEPLDPPEQGHMVNLDPTFGEQLLQISVGQSVAQVPAHRDQDDLRREPEAGER